MRLCRAGAAPPRSGLEVRASPAPYPSPRRAAPADGLRLEQRGGAAAAPAAPAAPTGSAAAAAAASGAGGGPGGAGAGSAVGAGRGPRVRAAVVGAAALLAAGLLAGPGVEQLGPHSELGPPGLRLQRLGHRPARLLGAHRLRALLLLHVADGQEGSESNCITNIITHGIGSWPKMCSSFRPGTKEEADSWRAAVKWLGGANCDECSPVSFHNVVLSR